MKVTHSILLTGPTGSGKSSFARKALETEGSGLVMASPLDELDSYLGLEVPNYLLSWFDDSLYLPSTDTPGTPTGHLDAVKWLKMRYLEVQEDFKAGKAPRYAVLVLDTVSAMSNLAINATMAKYSRKEPPPAMSPDGAAFYTYLRMRQEEMLRIARAFRGFGVHLIALSHEIETEVGEEKIATAVGTKSKQHLPAVHGSFKIMLPSYFSTVLHAGVIPGAEPVHYVQWKADPKRPTKNRFGSLGVNDKIKNDWVSVKAAIEKAAMAKIEGAK